MGFQTAFFKIEVLLPAFLCIVTITDAVKISNATVVSNETTQISSNDSHSQKTIYIVDKREKCDCYRPTSIAGGTIAKKGMFPFAVFVQIEQVQETVPKKYQRDGFDCGGTLVTDRHVLTAAHCVFNTTIGEHDITLTTGVIDKYEEVKKISRVTNKYIVHPLYDDITNENDIALIELKKPVNLGDHVFHGIPIKTAILPSRYFEMKTGTTLTAIGWGLQEGNKTTRYLRYVQLPKAECYFTTTDGQFCAGGVPKYDTCEGDSGGPILLPLVNHQNYVQVGLTSFGDLCVSKKPGVYTNVAKYVDWIYKHTMSASCAPCMFEIQTV